MVPSMRLKHTARGSQTVVQVEGVHLQGQPLECSCLNFTCNSRILGFYWIFQLECYALVYSVEMTRFWSPRMHV